MLEVTPQPTAAPPASARLRVFSGIQPSDAMHLGNYLGAVRNWVRTQDARDSIFCVVDLHALTLPEEIDPRALHENSRTMMALLIACGLDPEKNVMFIQSHVREHSELAWILNCVTPLGWLYRMTQFKAKSESRESVGTGLLDYPVLQAADILLYDTALVPVGEDQLQHIELTRDIATRFNHLFGETFVLPKAVVPEVGARVMGLDDPTVKMSKSIARSRPGHAIGMLDDEATVKRAIMSAVTDSARELRFEHASPGVRNLLGIYQALTEKPQADIEQEFAGKGYGDLKKALLAQVIATLKPIQQRYRELMADRAALEQLIARGAERAREIAVPVIERVRRATGVG